MQLFGIKPKLVSSAKMDVNLMRKLWVPDSHKIWTVIKAGSIFTIVAKASSLSVANNFAFNGADKIDAQIHLKRAKQALMLTEPILLILLRIPLWVYGSD